MLLKEKASHWLYLPVVSNIGAGGYEPMAAGIGLEAAGFSEYAACTLGGFVVIMLVMLLLTQSRGPIIALVLAVGCTLHLHVFTRRNLLIAAALAVLVALLLVMTPVGDMLLARFEELGTQSGLRLSIWHHTLSEMASQPWLGRGFSYELDFINYSGEHITTTHSVYMGALLKGGIVGLLLLYVYHQQSPETWVLFWLPLGIALSKGLAEKRANKRAVSGPFLY